MFYCMYVHTCNFVYLQFTVLSFCSMQRLCQRSFDRGDNKLVCRTPLSDAHLSLVAAVAPAVLLSPRLPKVILSGMDLHELERVQRLCILAWMKAVDWEIFKVWSSRRGANRVSSPVIDPQHSDVSTACLFSRAQHFCSCRAGHTCLELPRFVCLAALDKRMPCLRKGNSSSV